VSPLVHFFPYGVFVLLSFSLAGGSPLLGPLLKVPSAGLPVRGPPVVFVVGCGVPLDGEGVLGLATPRANWLGPCGPRFPAGVRGDSVGTASLPVGSGAAGTWVTSLRARGELGAWVVHHVPGLALVGLGVCGFHVVLKCSSVAHISSNTISIYLQYLSIYLLTQTSPAPAPRGVVAWCFFLLPDI